MKIRAVVGLCGVLWAGAAIGRGETHGTISPGEGSPPAASRFVSGEGHAAADPTWYDHDGQGWGQFRNGYLWEDYCLQRRSCQTGCPAGCREPVRGDRGSCNLVFRARPACDGRAPDDCCDYHRERVAALDLFFDLLGWHPGRAHRSNCCEPLACDLSCSRDVPSGLPEAPGADADRGLEPADTASTPHGSDAITVPEPPPDLAMPPESLPALDQPGSPEGSDADRAPEIPRNELPARQPAVPRSSRRSEHQTRIAGRLSDYIRTR